MQNLLRAIVKTAIHLRTYGLAEMSGDLPVFIQLDGSNLHDLEGKVRIFLRFAVRTLIPFQINDNISYSFSLLLRFCCLPSALAVLLI